MLTSEISVVDGHAPGGPPWTVEAAVDSPAARIEMRRYRLAQPSAMIEIDSAPTLSSTLPRREGMRGTVHFEGERPMPVGNLLLRPAGVRMRSAGDGGLLGVLVCRFDPALFEEITGLDRWDSARLRRCAGLRSRPLSGHVRRLRSELMSPNFAGEHAIDALVRLLLVEIGRAFRLDRAGDHARGGLARWQLVRIDEALRAADGVWPNTSALAALCGLSRAHFSRAFADSTGTTLAAHAAGIRLDRARAMMREGGAPMARIAETLGFANPSAFGAAFRRATGETPARYARTMRAG